MKKFFSILCMLFVLLQLFSLYALAAPSDTQSYEIPEISVTFEIPSYLNVLSKGIKQNDPLFQTGEFDYIQKMSVIRDNEDYYLVYDKNKTFTIEIRLNNTSLGLDNMSKANEKKLQAAADTISKGSGVLNTAIYDNGTYKFIEVSGNSNEGSNTIFTESFITTYNKQDLTVSISSINDKPTENEITLIKSMIDSIKFPEERKIDLSALTPSLIGAFCILIIGFITVAVVRLKNISIPFLKLEGENSSHRIKVYQPIDEIKNVVSEITNEENNDNIEESDKNEEKIKDVQDDVQPADLSEEELAAAIANFSD